MRFGQLSLVGIALLAAAVPAASGQAPKAFTRGFGVSPLRVSVAPRPGARVVTGFTVSNADTRGPAQYMIKLWDLGQNESGAVSRVPLGRGARSCAPWVDAPPTVTVPAGSSRKIRVAVRCPPGARGAYYAILSVSPVLSARQQDMRVAVRPTVGVWLEVAVPRPAPSRLDTEQVLYEAGRGAAVPSVLLSVKNAGLWKKPVQGDVLIYHRPGHFPLRTSVPYGRDGRPLQVYPGMTLALRCPLARRLEPGTHRVSVRLDLTQRAQARKEFQLEVPGGTTGAAIAGEPAAKRELDLDLSVQPSVVEITTPPGGRRTLAIRVRNRDLRKAHVQVDVTKARMERNGMLTYVEAGDTDAAPWLTVSPVSFDLGPNRSTAVRVQASIPRSGETAAPLIRVLRLQAEAPSTPDHADWASGGEYPVLIVIQDPRAPAASLETVSFDVVRPNRQQNPTAAVILVKNTGGKVARAYGRITLERTSGEEIAYMDIGASQGELILPGGEREFRMPLPTLDKGEFRIRAEISPGPGGGEKAVAEEEFETYTDIPEGLKKASEEPSETGGI